MLTSLGIVSLAFRIKFTHIYCEINPKIKSKLSAEDGKIHTINSVKVWIFKPVYDDSYMIAQRRYHIWISHIYASTTMNSYHI